LPYRCPLSMLFGHDNKWPRYCESQNVDFLPASHVVYLAADWQCCVCLYFRRADPSALFWSQTSPCWNGFGFFTALWEMESTHMAFRHPFRQLSARGQRVLFPLSSDSIETRQVAYGQLVYSARTASVLELTRHRASRE
jgi:hypothetical protein